ncbi:hypothetical protein IMZ29_07115 [Achromobacter sp. GG226]|uniref:hypothetical protein n=1 Tax=Verticiella alkaliphila TaxID=2779529 RepID=UPI001C0B2F19|nr:hypothetical protein [Verticiella sp. GG226]MBU4610317.1 hypothetical protein [Verticiella sp. GG226]
MSDLSRVKLAYQLMQTVYQEAVADGDNEKAIARRIDRSYPWGPRAHWPYKAWLAARREFFEAHGLPLRMRRSIKESLSVTSP